ncbi:MAG: phosphotransferase [Caldilineaceae bacterium]|nr:phosphotransferase [Caldilineaceae bacterium]
MNWHNIDPTLPHLSHVFDSSAAMHRFAQQPSMRCRRQSIEYIPGTRCTATYLLSQEDAAWQTIGVVEIEPAGIEHRLFTEDPLLASLPTAMDANRLTAHFAVDHAALGQIDAVIPVRYKPGSRCTLRYHTRTQGAQSFCFGKLLAKDSAEIAQAVDDLYRASQSTPELPGVAQPLAYWPELNMLVQAAVAGAELHDLAFDPQQKLADRISWMRTAGRAAAALHSAAIDVTGQPQTLAGDLVALDEYKPALRQINPHLADRFEAAIALTAKTAHPQRELASVLSHGALRTDQFMVEGDHLVLIDLDSLCWSSPARDLGNFLAYLTWKALRQPHHAAFIQLGQQAFLEGYQTFRALPDAQWISHYHVASILKVLGRRYTGLTYREWPLTEQLLDIAVGLIRQ